MKNITLTAEEDLIKRARLKAQSENKSLNELFREWLERYAGRTGASGEYAKVMARLSYAKPGRKFTRAEMNER